MILHDAEIFAAGEWPGQGATGVSFSETDLDGIVSSFNTLGLSGRVPIKVGHMGSDSRQDDTAPSLGWVTSVRRDGGKLLADINFTSDKLVAGIKAGAYKFVSAELLRNVQAHSRQIPWVLDAVALLGATAPAVGILKDLQTSMQSFSRQGGLRLRGERLAFKRDDAIQSTSGEKTMDEAAVQAAIAKAVEGATASFKAQVDGLTTKLNASEAETAKARAQAHRFAVMAPFEAGIKGGLINAAAKDLYVKTYAIDDDTRVLNASVKGSEEFIESVKDLPKFKGPGATRKTVVGAVEEDLTGKTTGEVMVFTTEKQCVKDGGKTSNFEDMERASFKVLRTHRHLAQQYFADPQATYEPPTDKSDAA